MTILKLDLEAKCDKLSHRTNKEKAVHSFSFTFFSFFFA